MAAAAVCPVAEYAGASQLADAGWPSQVLHLCPAELMPGPADSDTGAATSYRSRPSARPVPRRAPAGTTPASSPALNGQAA